MSRPFADRPRPATPTLTRRPRPAAWRPLLAAILAAVLVAGPPRSGSAQVVPELRINSEQYIVVDAETGEVFAQRAANQRAAMASLTKVFTAIQAIEEAPPDYLITIDESDMPHPRASFMGFEPGETYTLEELLHGLMLPSGNDAAHAIARSLGTESEDDTPEEAVARFVGRMNQRVQDMGLTDTHLVNPDGWGVPGHYTTPRDLAAFMRYALQYPRFVELISTASYTLHDGREIYNNNRLLNSYSDLLGGKTGYDDDAGWCLIEVAQRDGETMISVTFDGIHESEDWYDDNRVLLEYAFEQKAERLTRGGGIEGVVVSFKDPDAAVLGRTATSGASVGVTRSAVQDLPAASDTQANAPGVSPGPALSPQSAGNLLPGQLGGADGRAGGGTAGAVLVVVGLVLAARAMGAYAQPMRRASDVSVLPPRHRRRARRGPRERSATARTAP